MKRTSRIIITAGCAVLLFITWIVTISSESSLDRQRALIVQAAEKIDDGVYILAVPLLEQAAGYNTAQTIIAEEKLKQAYLALMDNWGFRRRYTELLDRQMSRRDAPPDVFAEAANYYFSISRITQALTVLKNGIEATGCEELIALYESNRYAYETIRTSYEYIAAIHGVTMQVQREGLWGIARLDGTTLIPCMYEKISTFSDGTAIVMSSGEIFAVDGNNNRIALHRGGATDIGNLSDNRIALNIDGIWRRASGSFALGTAGFERIGTYSGGFAAARLNGSWGVVDVGTDWLISPEYDAIIVDELGRCYGQGAVFVRNGSSVYLYADGRRVGGVFEDARPFSNEGYAAVMQNGKWGFIDTDGILRIDFAFDDALSFGQHLAAVRIGEHWGYICINGQIVIEPIFLEAKSFSDASAPVRTERGWQIIRLLEYK